MGKERRSKRLRTEEVVKEKKDKGKEEAVEETTLMDVSSSTPGKHPDDYCTPEAQELSKLLKELPHNLDSAGFIPMTLFSNLFAWSHLHEFLCKTQIAWNEKMKNNPQSAFRRVSRHTGEEADYNKDIACFNEILKSCDLISGTDYYDDRHPLQVAPPGMIDWLYSSQKKVVQCPAVVTTMHIACSSSYSRLQRFSWSSSLARVAQISSILTRRHDTAELVRLHVDDAYENALELTFKERSSLNSFSNAWNGTILNLRELASCILCFQCSANNAGLTTATPLLLRTHTLRSVDIFLQACYYAARAAIDCSHKEVLYVCLLSPSYISDVLIPYIKLLKEETIKKYLPIEDAAVWTSICFYYPDPSNWTVWPDYTQTMEQLLQLFDLLGKKHCKSVSLLSVEDRVLEFKSTNFIEWFKSLKMFPKAEYITEKLHRQASEEKKAKNSLQGKVNNGTIDVLKIANVASS